MQRYLLYIRKNNKKLHKKNGMHQQFFGTSRFYYCLYPPIIQPVYRLNQAR